MFAIPGIQPETAAEDGLSTTVCHSIVIQTRGDKLSMYFENSTNVDQVHESKVCHLHYSD